MPPAWALIILWVEFNGTSGSQVTGHNTLIECRRAETLIGSPAPTESVEFYFTNCIESAFTKVNEATAANVGVRF